jgi:hypothetical protein
MDRTRGLRSGLFFTMKNTKFMKKIGEKAGFSPAGFFFMPFQTSW